MANHLSRAQWRTGAIHFYQVSLLVFGVMFIQVSRVVVTSHYVNLPLVIEVDKVGVFMNPW